MCVFVFFTCVCVRSCDLTLAPSLHSKAAACAICLYVFHFDIAVQVHNKMNRGKYWVEFDWNFFDLHANDGEVEKF